MEKKLTDKQVQAYQLVSGDFEGLSTTDAAKRMAITTQALNRLLSRTKKLCPQLFPILNKQESDVRALLALGWANEEMADKLQVSLSRISQIIGKINSKEHTTSGRPIKMLTYSPHMDNKIRRKF